MPYAQKNYGEIQGIKGIYKVSKIGCFITAYCNLLERDYGININPSQMNAHLKDRNFYIDVDDGVKDDVNFYTLAKLFPEASVDQEGPRTSSMPPHARAIVRIKSTNQFGTHFCLVDHIKDGVVWVLDSYDGTVKKASVYGPIQGWATYKAKPATPSQPTKPNQGAIEMIANHDQATKVYKMLRPNSGGSEAEINGTAGKRTFAEFINSAQAEIEARDRADRERNIYIQALQNDLNSMKAMADELAKRPTKSMFDELHTSLEVCSAGATAQLELIDRHEKDLSELRAKNGNKDFTDQLDAFWKTIISKVRGIIK